MLERFPEPLLRLGPLGLQLWQWLALPLALLAAVAVGWLLATASRRVLAWLLGRLTAPWASRLVHELFAPLVLAWTLLVTRLGLPYLHLPPPAAQLVRLGTRVGAMFLFFWVLWRAIDVVRRALVASSWAGTRAAARALLPLAGRVLKALIAAMALIALFSELGYPVASLIAGLGIGGLAVALAAQKTVENLFGAFALGVDQPFREGDFVKIDDFMGTVEAIGLRSTRFRTLERTVISLPNGKLAEQRVESFTERDRFRFACNLGLTYGTTTATVRAVLAALEAKVRGHPQVFAEGVSVRLVGLGQSALELEVSAWFLARDWDEFTRLRQELLLDCLAVIEGAGATLAYPTQTVHLRREAP